MRKRIKDLWKAIRKWLKGKKKPKKVENLTSEINMARDVTLTWTLPTARTGGGELPIEEIQHVIVELSADGGENYSAIETVLPTDVQQFVQNEMEAGAWHFRLVVWDTLGQQSAPGLHVETVADESPPNPVENITGSQV